LLLTDFVIVVIHQPLHTRSSAMAKMTVRCAQYTSALNIENLIRRWNYFRSVQL